jgi:hypothetical protein
MAGSTSEWNLITVEIFTKPAKNGNTVKINAYQCGGSQTDLELNVEMVRWFEKDARLEHLMRCGSLHYNQYWMYKRSVDSGIAVISTALQAIHGGVRDHGMTEKGMEERREAYAQQCLGSIVSNLKTAWRSPEVGKALG